MATKKSSPVRPYIIAAILFATLYFVAHDRKGPDVQVNPEVGRLSAQGVVHVRIVDSASPLRNYQIEVVQGGVVHRLPGKVSGREQMVEISLEVSSIGLSEGPFSIQVSATDRSFYRWFKGNRSSGEWFFSLDTFPPNISQKTIPSVKRGGAMAVAFTSDEVLVDPAVMLGDLRFPAFELGKRSYVAIVPYPVPFEGDYVPRFSVKDEAGNLSELRVRHYHGDTKDRQSNIEINDRFIEDKKAEYLAMARQAGFEDVPAGNKELFLLINDRVRAENRRKLREIASGTAPRQLWQGTFLRQPGSATLGYYGDHRTYSYNRVKIDRQYHLGVDLASVVQAELVAAAAGTVLYADRLGIYGNCVVIDHGLNVQTLYGHMSSLAVRAGDRLERGDRIGNSGSTGQSGGDHLHFGVLIGGVPVTPVEWWDAKWVNRIEEAIKGAADVYAN